MTIFLTGGKGKVARRIAEQLQGANGPRVLRASRSLLPNGLSSNIRFDWSDRTTFATPFKHQYHVESSISAVFIVLPVSSDPDEDVMTFVHLALERGVNHFVLLSSAITGLDPKSAAPHGRIHHRLQDIHEKNSDVRVSVLRPAFFMQNFSESKHQATIRKNDTIYSATGSGTEAFIACEDIASVVVKCLLEQGDSGDYYNLGPEALSHNAIARILSQAIGSTITHTQLGEEDYIKMQTACGMPEKYARMMAGIDLQIANGHGEQPNGVLEDVLGSLPFVLMNLLTGHGRNGCSTVHRGTEG